jgi:hypothetical protein
MQLSGGEGGDGVGLGNSKGRGGLEDNHDDDDV